LLAAEACGLSSSTPEELSVTGKAVVLVAGKDPLVSIGGHGTYVRAHARALLEAGFDPHIFSVDGTRHDLPTPFGVVHRARSPLWPDRPWMVPAHVGPIAQRIERWVRETGRHEVMIHGFGLWGGVALEASRRLARRGIRAPVIVSAYATYEYDTRTRLGELPAAYGLGQRLWLRLLSLWAARVVDRYERRGYTEAHLVLINYESVRRLLTRRYGPMSRCQKIPYTSESAFLRAAPEEPEVGCAPVERQLPGSAPRVVAVSRHDPRKGIDVLLHALARLRARGVECRALLVGGGPLLAAHRGLAARLGLETAVAMEGFVPDPYPYLQQADAFALPSRREHGSLALIEALQAGVPVVASDCDGIPEDVEDGRSALLVPSGDVEELSRALERVLRDPTLRQTLARGARDAFRRRFSPAVFAHALREVYAELGVVP
jgi:glycosyltransferase involved in cell wall biosynthesis